MRLRDLALVGGIFLLGGIAFWARDRFWVSVPRRVGSFPPAATPEARVEGTAPFDFRRALTELDELIEAVDGGDWAGARSHFEEFQRAVRALPSPGLKHPEISRALVDFFALYRVQLERALSAQDAAGVLFACNQLGDILWDLRVQLGRAPLPELGRLRYLGRDLRYWSEVGDETMIRVRALGLEEAWNDLRPVVSGESDKKVVARVDDLLAQLRMAHQVEEYQEIATELEEAVRQIEAHLSDARGGR